MNQRMGMSLLAGLWLVACNPSAPPVSYFEPMNIRTGESNGWFLPLRPAADQGRANQAAGSERLGVLSGTTDAVHYRMLDRFSAFMLSGDVSTGTPAAGQSFETLQLPASPPAGPGSASGERLERTLDVSAFTPRKWTSFRVYNRGACSSITDWPSLAQSFGDGIADQLNDNENINNASLTGSLGVVLRFEFHNSIGVPDDRDELHFRAHMTADSITSCRNVGLDIDFTVALEHTDRMQLPVEDRAFAVACRLGDELATYNEQVSNRSCQIPGFDDPFWLDPQQTTRRFNYIEAYCNPDNDNYAGPVQRFIERIATETQYIEGLLAAGRPVTCNPGARMFFSLEASDWTLRRHRELSGRGASDDTTLLLGLATMDGHDLGAHDTLARVLSVSVDNFTASGRRRRNGLCRNPRRRGIKDNLKAALRDSLPLGINAAVRSGAVQGPANFLDPNDWLSCSRDADCDFRSQRRPPAYALLTGPDDPYVWRGARAVCRAAPGNDECSTDRVCWPAIEADRVNVRPDGLEVVVEDDIDLDVDPQDPQVTFFSGLLVRQALCDLPDTIGTNGSSEVHTRPDPPDFDGFGFLGDSHDPVDKDRGDMTFAFSATSGSGGPVCLPPLTDAP